MNDGFFIGHFWNIPVFHLFLCSNFLVNEKGNFRIGTG